MLLRTLQSKTAEPNDHWWKVTSGFHTAGKEAPTLPSTHTHRHTDTQTHRHTDTHTHTHTPDVREPAETGGQRYSWRLRARGLAAGRQGNREGAACLSDPFPSSESATFY